MIAGLSAPAAVEPAAHEDDYFRLPVGYTRTTRFMDRPRCQQAWPLLQLARAKDGALRILHQCAVGPSARWYPTEDLRWQDQSEGQDPADSCQQLDRMDTLLYRFN